MSMKGGYKIIDLKRTDFESGVEATVPGVYEAIESTNKRTIVSGLVLDDVEYDDFPALFTVIESGFNAYIPIVDGTHSITIDVADDDGVTVTMNELLVTE